MRKITLAFLTFLGIYAYGRQLTVSEAIARAASTNKSLSTTESQLAHMTTQDGNNTLYIINTGKGFTILSADDCAPAILGKSDRAFDANNIPSNVAWWLDEYSKQISAAIDKGSKLKAINIGGKDISPLLKTIWNQGAPFNNMCPEFKEGTRAVTGCVATATAQIMNYHQWPKNGTGSYSYDFNAVIEGENTKAITVSANFGETTYKWDDMLDSYNEDYTEANAEAVATLMYHVGASVTMSYDPDGSGALSSEVPLSLLTYFGYDKGMEFCLREFTDDTQWKNKIYSELSAKRPVYYSGSSTTGGHAFVCDGYQADESLFHFNWGWGGYCDGYYSIIGENALAPSGSGIGGGAAGEGYISSQTIITGIRPDNGGSIKPSVVSYEQYSLDQETVNRSQDVKLSGEFYNFTIVPIDLDFGVRLVSISDKDTYFDIYILSAEQMEMYHYYTGLYFNTEIVTKNGTYDVYPIYRETGKSQWKEMNRAGGEITIPQLTVTGEAPDCLLTKKISMPYGNVTTANNVSLTLTIKAFKDFENKEIVGWIFPDEGGNSVGYIETAITMKANEEREFTMSGDLSSELYVGNKYYFRLQDYTSDKYLAPNDYGSISFEVVNEEDLPTTSITKITDIEPKSVDVFTLSGRKVRSNVNPAEAIKGLPRGIYIMGSKKIMVK